MVHKHFESPRRNKIKDIQHVGSKRHFSGCGHKSHTQLTVNFWGHERTINFPLEGKCITCFGLDKVHKVTACAKCGEPRLENFNQKHLCAKQAATKEPETETVPTPLTVTTG